LKFGAIFYKVETISLLYKFNYNQGANVEVFSQFEKLKLNKA